MGEVPKRTIAVDMDDVIFPFIKVFCRFLKKIRGINLQPINITNYFIFEEILNWSQEKERIKTLEQFFRFYQHQSIKPIIGADKVLKELKKCFGIVIVSGRQHRFEKLTLRWLNEHLSGLFDGICLCNHFVTDGNSISKQDVCRQIGAEWIIEDSLEYALPCADAGITVLLFGNYAWNRPDKPLANNIFPVKNWREVADYFEGVDKNV